MLRPSASIPTVSRGKRMTSEIRFRRERISFSLAETSRKQGEMIATAVSKF
jgi:hypothetical protein